VRCLSDADCGGKRCVPPNVLNPAYRCGECRSDNDCPASKSCGSNDSCRATTCAEVVRACGNEVFTDGVTLSCGTCAAPFVCDERQLKVTGPFGLPTLAWGHACGLPLGASCDARVPASCGDGFRCVWTMGNDPPQSGRCARNVTGDACTGSSTCRYEASATVNFGSCVANTCTALCSVDAHCLAGQSCNAATHACQ
jgi:hypothetical protein